MEKIDIDLTEYDSCTRELSASQLKALDALRFRDTDRRVLDIRPEPSKGDGYHTLRPGSIVGALELGDLSLQIKPKVSIQRLLYLASYAAGVDVRDEMFRFKQVTDLTLIEALAQALGDAAGRAFRQGLWQDYQTREEALHTVRGRIMVAEQIRRRFDMPLPVEVRYDEYTEDVTANRLIKAAARLLRRMRLNDSRAREGLRHIDATLANVALERFPPNAVPEVKFDRLNDHYEEAVAIARLILRHWSYEAARDEKGVRAPGFLMDMNKVFQQFVTRALREALGESGRTLRADDKVVGTLDVGGKIKLKPDLSLWEGEECTFVGDVKYKRTDRNDPKNTDPKIPNADLYQALAYAIALGLPGALLIYAKGEADPSPYCVLHAGKRLEVTAIDLAGCTGAIRASIAELAKRVECLRAKARAA